MPVKGTIVTYFGAQKNPNFNTVSFQSGINIKADRGEPVRCVNGGRVIYARWFKGYGNMIIVDHGDNFYTLYAHVEEMFKNKNDVVDTGEVIATVGDTGSLKGPLLHFQVRHHGKPLDPLEWFSRG
jgi:septal ring factor EnvC (AmiA/AmiB activator)